MENGTSETQTAASPLPQGTPGAAALLLLWLGFSLFALGIYGPALRGPFLSDDFGYVLHNPYVHELSAENLLAILDPYGVPARNTTNWAPLHLLGHSLEWSLWGARTPGYHVVNVLLHALTAALLALLLARRGVPEAAAALGGALFLVHPANVEAVAWIFQLKTIGALLLAQAALLLQPRRPLPAALLFAGALLFKAAALFALPVAVAFTWVAGPDRDAWQARRGWLWAWLAIAVLYAAPQFFAFERVGTPLGVAPEGWERLRTMFAIGTRYLAMATTSYGTSAFHEPKPVGSWLDPWWLAGVALAGLLTWRVLRSLAERREEGAWWLWAAAAYAPISQIFPFLYPMGDRYLYTVLPGLLGGAWFAGAGLGWRIPPRLALACGLALAVCFAVRSHERAAIWRSSAALTLDGVKHYPDGMAANLLRAAEAARAGDARGSARAAQRAHERGFDRFMLLEDSPDFAAVRNDPAFRAVIAAMAGRWLEDTRTLEHPTQEDLRFRARAHAARAEWDQAEALLERAIAMQGLATAAARTDLERLRALRRAEQRRGFGPRP